MGLAISLGYQADMKRNDEEGHEWAKSLFARVNAVLASEGIAQYAEADDVKLPNRRSCQSFPYSYLHYLRRAFALQRERPDQPLSPVKDGNLKADDRVVADASSMMDSHLLCHSDCEGLYVPIDFPDPIFPEDSNAVPGGMLGSSQGLLRELVEVAPVIGVKLENGELSPAEADRIHGLSNDETHPFNIELLVWFSLYDAARISIDHRTAIVFT
jgi:hypothetical protein